MEQRTIAFIGAGNMGRAIIAGLLKSGFPASLIKAVNRTNSKNIELQNTFGIKASSDILACAKEADVIVLGVKPQNMAELLSQMNSIEWQTKLVISIAAGISIRRLSQMANSSLNVIRVMPNTPSLIGEGMSGLYAPNSISKADRLFADSLLSCVGKICWVNKESDINGIIAAAGSAPAYFFIFMQAMQKEAQRQGFDEKTARQLIQQAALGAAKMVATNSEIELATLTEQVTSKGGTTAQALDVFNNNQLSQTVAKAMQAVVRRAEEMESQF